MSHEKASLQLRAQEIINASPAGMTTTEALERAIWERFKDDPRGMAKFAAVATQSTMKGLRKRTYELPDPDQAALFDIPSVIGVPTDEGDLLVPREHANLGQVRQWQKDGQKHHATQLLRFKRAGADLAPLEDEPCDLPWQSARRMIATRQDDSDG